MKQLVLSLLLVILFSTVVTAFSYSTIGGSIEGDTVVFTGFVISEELANFSKIELIINVTDESGSRDLPNEIIKTDFDNYLLDITSISEEYIIEPYFLMPAPNIESYHYQTIVPGINQIKYIGLQIIEEPFPEDTNKLYLSIYDNGIDDLPGNKLADFGLIQDDYTDSDDLKVGLNIFSTDTPVDVEDPTQDIFHIVLRTDTGMTKPPIIMGGTSMLEAYDATSSENQQNLMVRYYIDSNYEPPQMTSPPMDLAFGIYTLNPAIEFSYGWEHGFSKDTNVSYKFKTTGTDRLGEQIFLESELKTFSLTDITIDQNKSDTNKTDTNETDTNQTDKNETDTNTTIIKKCPVCAECSDWSQCKGTQVRICENCIEGKCVQYEDSRPCIEDATWLDAEQAIREAEEIILELQDKIDMTEAQAVLSEANIAFKEMDYETAYSKATQAKQLALLADPDYEPPEEEKEDLTGFLVIIILVIIAIVVYLNRNKLASSVNKSKKELNPNRCSVCGTYIRSPYTCDYCGNKVCYKHIRSHRGKNICTNCAQTMDLM